MERHFHVFPQRYQYSKKFLKETLLKIKFFIIQQLNKNMFFNIVARLAVAREHNYL